MRRRQILACTFAVTLPGSSKLPLPLTTDSIQVAIRRARMAWLEGKGDEFVNLFISTGEFIVPGQKWQGHDEILSAFQEFYSAYRVNRIDIRNLLVQENQAMVEWYWEQQDRETGEISRSEDAIAIDFQDSSIQRWREYIDDESLKGS